MLSFLLGMEGSILGCPLTIQVDLSQCGSGYFILKSIIMTIIGKKKDPILLGLLITLIIGLPLGIRAYDKRFQLKNMPVGAKEFTLTGSAHSGWVIGEVQAHDIVSIGRKNSPVSHPVIEVSRGDRVVLKLRSRDVKHGFSLKAYNIYIPDGIQPGKTVFASFTADKSGTFPFFCTVYCGDVHQHMKGTLRVIE